MSDDSDGLDASRGLAIERRLRFLLELEERMQPLDSPAAVSTIAASMLGTYLGVAQLGYAEIDADGSASTVAEHVTGSVPSLAGRRYRLDDYGISEATFAGREIVVHDVEHDELTRNVRANFAELSIRAFVMSPLVRRSRVVAFLYAAESAPRQWLDDELVLIRETAARTWAAIERTRAEQSLRASEERYRALFDSIDQGFCIVDVIFDEAGQPLDYVFVETNRAFQQQTGLADAAGRSMRALAPGHEQHWFEIYGRIALTGEPQRFEQRAEALGRWFSVYAFRVGDPQTHRIGILFEDITARKGAEQALVDANRRKDEFLAMLAHELRNPLAPIRTAAEALRHPALGAQHSLQMSEIIVRQVNHMRHIVDDLLDVSRVTHGLVELDLKPCDIRRAIAEAVEQVRPAIQRRRQRFAVHVLTDHAQVNADFVRLVQILVNILGNASKYTADEGEIVLTARTELGALAIHVRDTGVGIAADLLPHVFDLFTQADRSSARTHGGLGLGLALAKHLTELHGGVVEAYSAGLGLGAEFVVRLPVSRAHDAKKGAGASVDESAAGSGAAPLHVMVVDDNADAAKSLAMLLEIEGHEVTFAHDAAAVLDRVRAEAPDALILDIGLPDMDGYELARRLRALPATATTTLVALTGYGQDEDRRRSLEAGFDHHLVKPVDVEELKRVLHSH